MSKKLTQQQVEKEFADKGCELLERYEGNQKSMKYRCSCGEIAQTSLVGFRKSTGCYKCSESSAGKKFAYEDVRTHFLNEQCELLSNEYEGNLKLLDYKCVCGSIAKIRYADFKNGVRCQKCKGKNNSECFRTKDQEIIDICELNNCKFIKSFVFKKKTHIQYVCKCGLVAKAYLGNFKRFPNCWECGKAKKSGSNCYMYDPDREAVEMRKKFRKMCGQHIKRFMEATNQKKTKHTHELLGYYPKDLQEHILNHPNYKNCIGKEWHVDHVFPIQAFIDHGILDLKVINRLDNLRPILGPDNLQKADKYDEKEFMEWLNPKE